MSNFRILPVAILVATVFLGPIRARAEGQLAERLPSETCFALLTDDVAALGKSFQATNLGQLLSGEEFRPLTKELARREQPTVLHLRPWFGIDWDQLSTVPGPLAIAVFPHSKGKFGAACLLDGVISAEAKTNCLAAGEKYFTGRKFRRSVVKIPNGELILYEPPAGSKSEPTRVHFISGGLFGMADTRAAAETLLATKAPDSLANQAKFQELSADLKPKPEDPSVHVYVRPWELWQLSRNDRPSAKLSAKDPLAMAQRQGVPGLQAVAGLVRFPSDEPCDLDVSLAVAVASPFKKAMSLLDFRPGPGLPTPDWVPADATSLATWQWDFPTAMKAVGNLFDEFNEPGPDGEGLFDDLLLGLRDDPEGPKVDLRKDVFARLGPQVLSVSDLRGKSSPKNPRGERLLYVVACRETPQVAAILQHFYEGERNVTYEKSGDVPMWAVPAGSSLFVEGDAQPPVQFRAAAVSAGKVMFSTDLDMLKTAVAGKTPEAPLTQDKAYLSLQGWLKEPGLAAAQSFFRPEKSLESPWLRVRSGQARVKDISDEALLHFILFGTFDAKPNLPYESLPKFDRVRARLHPAGLSLWPTKTGWRIRGGVLRSEE